MEIARIPVIHPTARKSVRIRDTSIGPILEFDRDAMRSLRCGKCGHIHMRVRVEGFAQIEARCHRCKEFNRFQFL